MNERGSATDFQALIGDLNAGVLQQQIERALSDVALAVVTTGKAGSVTLTMSMKRIGQSSQIEMVHGVKYERPKQRGKVVETHDTETPLYVGNTGRLTLMPESQTEMFSRQNDD